MRICILEVMPGKFDTLYTRFAPTPSGFLHPGNACSLLLTWLIARANNGNVLLRIDDLDAERRRTEYLDDIFRVIDYLGIDYDLGPSGTSDFLHNWSQQTRMELYISLLEELWTTGKLYACSLSRNEIKELSIDGQYPLSGRQQHHHKYSSHASWRVTTPEDLSIELTDMNGAKYDICLFNEMRDFVLRKKDSMPAYQVASLADDMHFGINCIIRGQDLLASSAAQNYLAQLLGMTEKFRVSYFHHPLIMDEMGIKMSKSTRFSSAGIPRALDMPVTRMLGIVLSWAGFSPADCMVANDGIDAVLDFFQGNSAVLFDINRQQLPRFTTG